jgi:hypothetical protein
MASAAPVSEDLVASGKVLKNAPFTLFDKPVLSVAQWSRRAHDRLRQTQGERRGLVNIEALPFVSWFSPT